MLPKSPTVAIPLPLLTVALGEMLVHGHRMTSEEARATRRGLAQVDAYLFAQQLPRPMVTGQGGAVDAVDLALALVDRMEHGAAAEYSIRTPRIRIGLSVAEQPAPPAPKPKPKKKQTLSHTAQGRATRAGIRQALATGPKTTAELMEAARRTHSTTCHHLRRLEQAGEVTRSKRGLAAVWSLVTDDEPVAPQEAPEPPAEQPAPEPPEEETEAVEPLPEPRNPPEQLAEEKPPRGGGVHLM